MKAFKEYIKQEKNPEKIWNVELFNKYLNKKIYNNYPVEERFSCSGYENAEITPMDENKYRKSLINHPSFVYIGEIETKMGLQNGIVIRDPTRDARMISFCYKLPYQYFVYMGMPRCLIRRNLKDLIPNKILRNWRRYGEQNADWLLRIKRDKDSVIKTLSEAFGTDFNRDYVCKSEIQEEVRKYSFDQAIEENDLNSILFIFSVLKFMRLYQ